MIKKVYSSLSELQDDLDQFIYYYNFKRINRGYRLKGKTWAQVASAISSFGIIYQKKGVAHVPIPPIKC
jgi:hypothetical protein